MTNAHGAEWQTRDDGYLHCSWCGSLHPDEFLRRLTTPGCSFSGTDKGAYKFYAGAEGKSADDKFYGEHVKDLDESRWSEFDAASRRCLGVAWVPEGGKLTPLVPRSDSFYGWQTWGRVGPDGNPVHDEHAPTPPDGEWWAGVLRRRAESKQ